MTDWFLPAGAPASPDAWCFQSVATAEIRIYADYRDYYARLGELLAQTKDKDEVFLVGWGFGLEEVLKDKNSALFFLQAAKGRSARVRLLATPSHSWSDNQAQMDIASGKKPPPKGHPKGKSVPLEALIDDQLPANALHHQKAVLITTSSNTHLFVGGMDVTTNRVDQWFDVQAEVVGQGAALGRITLEERWESVKPPAAGVGRRRPIVATAQSGQHVVQFVRTYPPVPSQEPGSKRNYASKGDHTFYALLSQAIANAKKTIYLEEQFLWPMGTAPARSSSSPKQRSDVPDVPVRLENLLRDAIGRGVKVVIVGPHYASGSNEKQWRDAVIQTLASSNNPATLLQVRSDMMFVHSKTWIFDDEFVVIGSANFWHKSFISVQAPAEAELGVAFTSTVDGAALGFAKVSFARALRIKLWERIRRTRDSSYVFPRRASASFEEEINELKRPISGVDPFEPM